MASRERIYIIFHWSGLVLGLIVILIFATGFLAPHVSTLTQTLGITLVVAGIVALIQSNDNLRGLEIVACRSEPVPVGSPCVLELVVRNTSDRERVGLNVRTGWRVRPSASTWVPILEAGESQSVRLMLPTSRRGRFVVPQLWITTIRPMGLCFSWKIFPQNAEYFVYSAPRGRPLDPNLTPGAEHVDEGSHDVTGHRPYNPGDLLSRLDWRVFARSGKLVVRTLEEGEDDEVLLRWADTGFLVSTEARLEQLSFWIDECVREHRSFVLDLGGDRTDLTSANLFGCREALASYQELAS